MITAQEIENIKNNEARDIARACYHAEMQVQWQRRSREIESRLEAMKKR